MQWLAHVVALIFTSLIEKLTGALVAWSRRQAQKREDEKKTADALKQTKEAETEKERIAAARAAARNSGS